MSDILTREQYENMTKEQALAEIQNKVYEAAHLCERMEGVGKVHGNGHHMMQEIATFAKDLLEKQWID